MQSYREIIITGMHRSGTSAIAQLIHKLGVSVGPHSQLIPGARENRKGFFENLDVVSCNNRILQSIDSTWDNPQIDRLKDVVVDSTIRQEIRRILTDFKAEEKTFLLKDPRFSLTLSSWLHELNAPLIICCLRSPMEIARSLQKRNGFSVFKGLGLWEVYLRQLSSTIQNLNYIFVDFNKVLTNPEGQCEQIIAFLNKNGVLVQKEAASAIATVIESSLRNEEWSTSLLNSLLSTNQLSLWNHLQAGDLPKILKLPNSDKNAGIDEFLRQKNTDIGYADSKNTIQLFFDIGKGFSESGAVSLSRSGQKGSYTFSVPNASTVQCRLDPLSCRCVIESMEISAVTNQGDFKIEQFTHNGKVDQKTGNYFFHSDDPNVFFKLPSTEVIEVKVYLKFVTIEENETDRLISEFVLQEHNSDRKLFSIASDEFERDRKQYSDQIKQLAEKHHRAVTINEGLHVQCGKLTEQCGKLTDQYAHLTVDYSNISVLNKALVQTLVSRKGLINWILGTIKVPLVLAKLLTNPREAYDYFKYYRICKAEETFFSESFYINTYPDVLHSAFNPLQHFLLYGWKEGRKPSPDFNTKYYLDTYSDIKDAGNNPLIHYIKKGWLEGRNPSHNFKTSIYIADNMDLFEKKLHPLIHYRNKENNTSISSSTRLHKLNLERFSYNFKKHIDVIVPTYLPSVEAAEVFRKLIKSLVTSYADNNAYLHIWIIDDMSPTRLTKTILEQEGALVRDNFSYLENIENKGFVQTVNVGLSQSDKNSDIVILNCDTEVHGAVFERLQSLCYRFPKVASVTPLSNRATIACIDCWPHGTDDLYGCTPREIAESVHQTQLSSPNDPAPTGHGFCMYMAREAINIVGEFDEQNFSQGYGEENDWSVRAIRNGYKHLICTETYVHHHETTSFTSEQKSKLIKRNYKKLLDKHPFYEVMVHKYLDRNPLKNHRTLLKFLLLGKRKKTNNMNTICFFLHDSYKNHFGGVQRHIRDLYKAIYDAGKFEVIIISPVSLHSELYDIHLLHGCERLVVEGLDELALVSILKSLEERVDFLHLHHTMNLNDNLTTWAKQVKAKRKIFTFHDFYSFCSNPCLLDENGEFCIRNETVNACQSPVCSKKTNLSLEFLSTFDQLYVPSTNTLNCIKSLPGTTPITNKIEVLPHFLPFIDLLGCSNDWYSQQGSASKNIIFLGALCKHKGGDLFLAASSELKEQGFTPSVFGTADPLLLEKFKTNLPTVVPYKNWMELQELQGRYGVHIVVIPSIWAETFSYTLYEALFLMKVPVVVGQYGNPADVVNQWDVGEIIDFESPTGIADAVRKISGNYQNYKQKVDHFIDTHSGDFSEKTYAEKYLNLVLGEKPLIRCETPAPKRLYSLFSYTKEAQEIENRALSTQGLGRLRVLMVRNNVQNRADIHRFDNLKLFIQTTGNEVEVIAPGDYLMETRSFDVIILMRMIKGKIVRCVLEEAKKHDIPVILDINGFDQSMLNGLANIQSNWYRFSVITNTKPDIQKEQLICNKGMLCFKNRIWAKHLLTYKRLFQNRPGFKKKRIGLILSSDKIDRKEDNTFLLLKKYLDQEPDCEIVIIGNDIAPYYKEQHEKRILNIEVDEYENYLKELQLCKVVVSHITEDRPVNQENILFNYFEAGLVGTPIISGFFSEISQLIEHDITGWFANNQAELFHVLDTAMSGSYAEYIGECTQQYLEDHYIEGAESFNKLIHALVERPISHL